MTMPADLIIDDRIPYETALGRQNWIARERADNARTDALWLLEHEPIFTAGRTTNRAAWPGDEEEDRIGGSRSFARAEGDPSHTMVRVRWSAILSSV